MNMNLKQWVPWVVVAAVAVGVVWFIYSISSERTADQAKYKATLDQQGAVISELQRSIAARNEQAKAQDAEVHSATKQAKTTEQKNSLLVRRMSLPVAPTMQPSTTETAKAVILPQEDVDAAVKYTDDCEVSKNDLTALQSDYADVQKQLKATELERDSAAEYAKGGSRWTRFKRAGKWLAIGGGIVAGVMCGSGHCR